MFASRVRLVNIQARLQPAMQTIPAFGQVAVLALGGWLALHGHISLGTFLAFSHVHAADHAAGPAARGDPHRRPARARRRRAHLRPARLDAARAGRARRAPTSHVPRRRGAVRPRDVRLHVDRAGAPRLHAHGRAGRDGRARRQLGLGQVDRRAAAAALLRRARGRDHDRRRRRARRRRSHSLRGSIGVVFEDSFLFSDTITANIAFGRPDATAAEVEAAARAAEAHEFILQLPNGYDTVVGEQGLTLSGGQRQRVALARALLSDPKILLLDDATSSVDSRVEEEIHATLRRIASTRTTILIAHRRSTLSLADRIVVVDQGQVVDAGTHDELLGALPALPHAARRARATTPKASTRSTRSRVDDTQVDGITPVGVARPRRRRAPQRADRRPRPAPRARPRCGSAARAAAVAARAGWRGVGRRARADARAARAGRRARRRPTPIRTSTSRSRARPAPDFTFLALPAAVPRLAARRHVPRRARRGRARSPARCSCGTASTTASPTNDPSALWAASVVFLAITLFDWWVMWAEARVMGRTLGAAAARAAHQGVRPSAAARRRLLRARDGGPDHDPHDHRHRRAVAAAAERARERARQPRDVRRRRHRARVHRPAARADHRRDPAAAHHRDAVVPLAVEQGVRDRRASASRR